jgi:F0F1-type ATP synthase membrane subunit b/b'
MNDLINKELIKIQDELSALDNAVNQIEKAGTTANEVIKAIREVQSKYQSHLDYVRKKVDELLSSSEKNTQQKLEEITAHFKNQAEEIRKIFAEYHVETIKTQQANNTLLENTIKKNDEQITDLTTKHGKQVANISKLMDSYMDLAKSTATLNQEIQEVDFPTRLQNLENAAVQLNKVQVQLGTDIKTIDETQNEVLKKLKKSNRKANVNIFFNVLIFIVVLYIALKFSFDYFPQLKTLMDQYIK